MFAKQFIQTIFFISILSATSHAETNPYQSCGPKANLVTRLLTDAEKIRLACINDVYDKITQQRDKEVAELTETIQNVKKELQEVAFKIEYGLLHCEAPRGYPAHNPQKVARCKELSPLLNSLIDRQRALTEWVPRKQQNQGTTAAAPVEAPCPSKQDLKKMQSVRYFNKKLYKSWEKCVSLSPETYFDDSK